METTPKIKRKTSLSLSSRLNKRNSSSPLFAVNSIDEIDICTTPPLKKPNLDDSIDYSPKLFDLSFSPNAILSQSLFSAEVDWGWPAKTAKQEQYIKHIKTPVNTHGENRRKFLGRENRKTFEIELRKTEKTRADAELKRRIAKLQDQLNEGENLTGKENKNTQSLKSQCELKDETDNKPDSIDSKRDLLSVTTPITKNNNIVSDFFNDSDSDCLLLEATQQVEEKIVELTQQTKTFENKDDLCSAPTTPTSSTKEKRSSLYLQFLEDDSPDDWFMSLDEVLLQTTPRASFQRYKSMPESTTPKMAQTAKTSIPNKEIALVSSEAISKLKRHGSTYSLSPSSYRGRLHMRK